MPSLRLRGDYLAIVTLGFGEIIRVLIENTAPRRRRPRALADPAPRRLRLDLRGGDHHHPRREAAARLDARPRAASPFARTRSPPRRWASTPRGYKVRAFVISASSPASPAALSAPSRATSRRRASPSSEVHRDRGDGGARRHGLDLRLASPPSVLTILPECCARSRTPHGHLRARADRAHARAAHAACSARRAVGLLSSAGGRGPSRRRTRRRARRSIDVRHATIRFGGLTARLRVLHCEAEAARADGAHRPERRRQDHRVQPAHRRLPAHRRQHRVTGRDTRGLVAALRSRASAWRGRSRTSASSAS